MNFNFQIVLLISLLSVSVTFGNVKFRRDLTMSAENRPKPDYSNYRNEEYSRSSIEEIGKGKKNYELPIKGFSVLCLNILNFEKWIKGCNKNLAKAKSFFFTKLK